MNENNDLLFRLIPSPQSDGNLPRTTARVLVLSTFTQMSDPMPPYVLTDGDINFNKTMLSKLIFQILSA